MSEVKVMVVYKPRGVSEVSVDGRRVGEVEDPDEEMGAFLKKLIEALQIDNTEVVEVP